MSDRMPEDMPDKMPEDRPDRMPEQMPEDMSDRMPDRMPEDMSDRMPEDLPVTKRINVMVGITRSKVCFFSTAPQPWVFEATPRNQNKTNTCSSWHRHPSKTFQAPISKTD